MIHDRSTLALGVDVLGPLALRVEGLTVPVPGARRRALLALLALAEGRVVGVERLVDSLWPDEPPEHAVQALYNQVSRLRGNLGPLAVRLDRRGAGYRLHLEPDELDADAARRASREAADPRTPAARAAGLADAALELWRGNALEDFRTVPALDAVAVGLDELRLHLVDDLLEARLALAERGVSAEAAAAAAATPLRERTTLLLVRALASEGRTADAMAAAQAFRRRLVEETGLDPGPALADLEQVVATGTFATPTEQPSAASRRVVARPDGPLVGRERDREEVLRLLGTNATVTLTGPGGVGKTRLALDVAADPATGGQGDVVVVDLAAVDRPEHVCSAISSTLGLRTAQDVRPVDVAAALAERRVLLVLDNCEHLVVACRELVVTVRRHAPEVRVLATSRNTLHVPGEYVVRLQPLPVPRDVTDVDSLRRQPAVRAFIEHARRRRPAFDLAEDDVDAMVEVLRRLDGLPLGIELAARQAGLMPLRSVRDRLDRTLDLATGRHGPDDDRQRTLRATIDSSYRLLAPHEQWVLRALAPYPGGVDLATVEALAASGESLDRDPLDLLHRLVDASLVVADPVSARFRLLFTVRSFLLDELRGEGELAEAESRFLDRCLSVSAEIAGAMVGPGEPEADRWLRAELDNLRAARDVARAHGRDDVRVGITVALSDAVTWRDLREMWGWALELADDPRLTEHPDRAAILGCAAEAARLLGDLDRAGALARDALTVTGREPGPGQTHHAHVALGSVAHFRGDFDSAHDAWVRAAQAGPERLAAYLASSALAAAYAGRADRARDLLDRVDDDNARSGCVSHAAFAAYVRAELVASTDVVQAVPCYLEAIAGARRCGATFVEGVASVGLASARTRTGDVAGAAEGFGYLLDTWRRTGHSTQLWTTARNAAGLLAGVGRTRAAALLLICADDQPGAAVVTPAIARHSGRAFVPLGEVVAPEEVGTLRAEATRLTASGVLDLARHELAELCRPGG